MALQYPSRTSATATCLHRRLYRSGLIVPAEGGDVHLQRIENRSWPASIAILSASVSPPPGQSRGERKIGGRLLENRAVGDDDDALIL